MAQRARILLAAATATLAAAGALAVVPAATPSSSVGWLTFRTPSKRIACAYYAPALRCDVRPTLRPKPQVRCRLDWTGLELRPTEGSRPVCAGDTVDTGRAPVLRYGVTWARGGMTCASTPAGLRCRNRVGRGFRLAIGAWRLF